jgi:hypothetical protein
MEGVCRVTWIQDIFDYFGFKWGGMKEMKTIIPGILMKERRDNKKRKIKKNRLPTPRMRKTLEQVKQGCSIQKAMELAGYSPKTIKHRWRDYLDRLDIQELMRGLKTGTAILHYQILKVLDEELKGDDVKERLRAADIGARMGKVHLVKEEVPSNITFAFQTINAENIQINQGKDNPDKLSIDGRLEDKE